jgi:hypothetical protein
VGNGVRTRLREQTCRSGRTSPFMRSSSKSIA